jgi:hypothetical protein
LTYFVQLTLAIGHLHEQRILHRDLKTQNVFLTQDGNIKLGDFGIAKVMENSFQMCQTQIGSPYFLSPEICEGRKYNAKTDVWSLGCVLFELCTLRHAFCAQDMGGLLMSITNGNYGSIPPTYSRELKQLIGRLLTKDPNSRPSIREVLSTPLLRSRVKAYRPDTPRTKVNAPSARQTPVVRGPFSKSADFSTFLGDAPVWARGPQQRIGIRGSTSYFGRTEFHEDDVRRQLEMQRVEMDNKRLRMRALELGVPLGGAQAERGRIHVQRAQTPAESVVAARGHLDRIHNLAGSIRDDVVPDEEFDVAEMLRMAEMPTTRDGESYAHRAETIRAFLENELGVERFIALKQLLQLHAKDPAELTRAGIPANLIIMTQQLLLLDMIVSPT